MSGLQVGIFHLLAGRHLHIFDKRLAQARRLRAAREESKRRRARS